ncbi:MAG: radical SAM family heme chaperone HemW [Opitutae bacterium]|nr:radical SAM family heme chaperone HemW [Opitutae bacterium]
MAGFPAGQEKSPSGAGAAPAASAPALGVYVHVPFCATTCDFCAFYQTVPKADAVPRYLAAIRDEMALVDLGRTTVLSREGTVAEAVRLSHDEPSRRSEILTNSATRRRVDTAFWGGGTPGLLRAGELEQLGRAMVEFCGGAPAEWSVEMAPATVTAERLAVLRALGVTRISLGVQSFNEALLDALGRQHTPKQVYRAYDLIRAAGFPSVNMDLMFALPNQSEEQWRADLDELVRLAPDHLSTYCLTFEEDTALWVKLSQGKVKLDPEKEAAFYLRTWDYLAEVGFAQYEVSNFARPGHACAHNLNTWRMHEWIGFGPSGASQFAGWRASNPPDLTQWHADVAAGRRATADRTALAPELLAADSVIFGLRMNEGVSLPELRKKFPSAPWENLHDFLPKLIAEGMLADSPEGRIRLTSRGRLLADAVGAEVLEAFSADSKAAGR